MSRLACVPFNLSKSCLVNSNINSIVSLNEASLSPCILHPYLRFDKPPLIRLMSDEPNRSSH